MIACTRAARDSVLGERHLRHRHARGKAHQRE
jgi:hypothetical protein